MSSCRSNSYHNCVVISFHQTRLSDTPLLENAQAEACEIALRARGGRDPSPLPHPRLLPNAASSVASTGHGSLRSAAKARTSAHLSKLRWDQQDG
jgi:hypothetical protein